MATQEYRIVTGEDSEIHDEPHIEGRRLTVRLVHERVEERGSSPERVAERHGFDIIEASTRCPVITRWKRALA